MSDALRYEWVRLRTLRSTWWLTGLSILASTLLGLTALNVGDVLTTQEYAYELVGGPVAIFVLLMSVLLGMIGVFSLGHEYRYGTIRPTLGALPRRSVIMAAKVVVVVAYVAGVGLVCQLGRYLVMLLILGSKLTDKGLFPPELGRIWLGTLFYPVVFALTALALAGLFRSVPTAIVVTIVMPVIVEGIVRALLSIGDISTLKDIGKLLPFTAGLQVMRYTGGEDNFDASTFASPWYGALTFSVFMGVLLALCWTLFEKRDA
ncbi:MAG: type transport system permease protein [Frankiales bacterium]|jgi:ABC-2 type transport system permease protein|nr:type transport system permease protein [Frankiales bacterium]